MTMPCSPTGCPMDALLRLLMGPWTTYILYVLRSNGPTRFGELKRRVPGISAKVLTARLRMLEESEVLVRHYEPTIPPQVTYALSARGLELADVIDQGDAHGTEGVSGHCPAARLDPRAGLGKRQRLASPADS
jgi:DNA-binding HxlR family transcriptional regulator